MENSKKSKDTNLELKDLENKLLNFEKHHLLNSTKKSKSEQRNEWLEISPVCTKIIDANYKLLYMSSAGINALKINNVDNYYGKPYPFEFFPDFAKNSMREKLVKVKNTGETDTLEAWLLDMEGIELCFLSTINRVNDEDGNFNYLMVVSTEITDRKRVESKVVALNEDLKLSNEALYKTNCKRKIINSFSEIIQKALTIEDVVWSVAKNVIAQLDYVDCVIYLLDETEEYLVQKAAYGNKNPDKREILNPIKLRFGEGIVGDVADSKRGEIIADTRKDDRYVLDDVQRFSEITVPIIHNDKVIGVIDSEHPEINFFSEDCLELIATVATMTATKLIQTKYYEELKKSKEKIIASAYKLEESQRIAKLGHYEYDFLSNLWESSKTVSAMLGLDKLNKKDKNGYLDFICFDNPDEIKTYFNNLIKFQKKQFNKEHRVVNSKTKEIIWVINKGFFIYNENNKPVKMFGTIQDITKRKIAEERLIKREERFRNLFENSMEITLIANKEGMIEFVTAAVYQLMGYRVDELIGQNLFNYIHPEDVVEAHDRFETRYNEGGRGVYRIFRVKTKSGIYKHLRMITSNHFSELSINGFVINAHDVTALINAEKEKYNAIFETKESERKRISHDLHDGLGQTIVAANMYMNSLDHSLLDQLDEETYLVFEKGKHLVNDAAKEARIVSHNFMPATLKENGLEHALEKLLNNYQIIKKELTISLNSNLREKRFDVEMELTLFRIIQESVSNALKYANCKQIKVNININKTELCLQVIDDGVGFNIEEVAKREDSGIGLKSLKDRVNFLGGQLLIESTKSKGTNISIIISF